MNAMGVKSFCGSYSTCLFRIGSMTSAELAKRRVWPSDGAAAAALEPMVVPPPGLLSMTTAWPSLPCRCCAKSRAMTSLGEPGVKGTMMRTGFAGKVCASAAGGMPISTSAAIATPQANVPAAARLMPDAPWKRSGRGEVDRIDFTRSSAMIVCRDRARSDPPIVQRPQGAGAGIVSKRRMLVGLIGANIQGSMSPALFADAFAAAGIDGYYHLLDVDRLPGRSLPQLLDAIKAAGFAGANVTYPFKQAIIPLLDAVDPEAAQVGAVSTVAIEPEAGTSD